MNNSYDFPEIGSQRMCKRLIVMRIICYTVAKTVSKRPYNIQFTLKVEVFNGECIYVFGSKLVTKFIRPPSFPSSYLIQFKFIQQPLAIELEFTCYIGFKICTHQSIIRTTILLFGNPEEHNGVE